MKQLIGFVIVVEKPYKIDFNNKSNIKIVR